MSSQKVRVGLLFGGRSAEHEVSLMSARSVMEAIPKDKYEVVLIGIEKSGRWCLQDPGRLLGLPPGSSLKSEDSDTPVDLVQHQGRHQLVARRDVQPMQTVDVVFPILHGPFGEDGTVQGMLKLLNLPFVGASVLGSAVGMDKDVMKRLLRDAGIPVAPFRVLYKHRPRPYDELARELGPVMFVKPANLGSSVGIHKVKDEASFEAAIRDAWQYDHKLLVEAFIEGREIELSVLGNEQPMVSIPGEIVPQHEYYSYEAKYIDDQGALLEIPARLLPKQVEEAQNLALRTFEALCCEGMGRVDMFLTRDGRFLVNEINTIPGFTKISMYPKLWEASGMPYSELVDRLIQLALDRHQRDSELRTSVA